MSLTTQFWLEFLSIVAREMAAFAFAHLHARNRGFKYP